MFYIIIISLIIYVIAVVMIHHNTYNLTKNKEMLLIVSGILITIISTIILTDISTQGIKTEMTKQLSVVKTTSILLFSPINLIISAPYIGYILNKKEVDAISESSVRKKILILLVILILISIFEVNYIKDFQIGLLENMAKIH